jgi:hypothetical protein
MGRVPAIFLGNPKRVNAATTHLCECGASTDLSIERANSALRTSKLGVSATIIPRKNQ